MVAMVCPQIPCAVVVCALLLSGASAVKDVADEAEFARAIESAANGDTIRIAAGRYLGVCGIELSTSLTIVGTGRVSFDCASQRRHLLVSGTGNNVTLHNLEFVNGNSGDDGGCVSASSGARLDIISCSFSECVSSGLGGAISVNENAVVHVTDSAFTACTANQGGAVSVGPQSSISVSGCHFVNNSAAQEGGAVLLESAVINVEGSTVFKGNIAPRGGAMAAKFATNSTYPCAISIAGGAIFEENFAEEPLGSGRVALGGAIYFVSSGSLVSAGEVLYLRNAAHSEESAGGAFYINAETAVVVSGPARISGGFAYHGGGMWVGGGAHVEVREGVILAHNEVIMYGGGIYSVGAGTVLHVQDNVRVEYNSALTGGGIVLAQGPSLKLLHNVTLSNNYAVRFGGAVFVFFLNHLETRGDVRVLDNHADLDGGGIGVYMLCTASLSQGTTFKGNSALRRGGGLTVNFNSVLNASHVTFTDNHVIVPEETSDGGGAVCQDCTMNVWGCYFARNFAPTAAAIAWKGGGACVDSHFEHNVAHIGAGLAHFSDVALTLTGSSFFNNSAMDGGCLLSADKSIMLLSNTTFMRCTAHNNGAAVLIKDDATVHLSRTVTVEQGTAGGTGGGIHHQGKLLHVQAEANIMVTRNSAAAGGGISATKPMTVGGELRVRHNVALRGDGGGVLGLGVMAVTTVEESGWLEVAENEAVSGNGGGVALLDNARLSFDLQSTCPASCQTLADGICDAECVMHQCRWDEGDCDGRFLDAGNEATQECIRDSMDSLKCPFWGILDTSLACLSGCLSASCDWGFDSVPCAPAVKAIGECPYTTALIYKSVVANPAVRYVSDGGTADGFGRCQSETCSPADSSIGRDVPYCTTINDGGRVMELDCAECTTYHDTGVEAWGPCAPQHKPRLPHVGFDYDPAEMLAIADMDVSSLLRQYPSCGYQPIAIRRNTAALAGGGVYKDRCEPFLESADRCFVGELDNQRLPTIQIDVADNVAGGPGGGVYVECAVVGACLRAMRQDTGLPMPGNTSQQMIHFGDHSTSGAFGAHAAAPPARLELVSQPGNYTPGQTMIDLRFRLLDSLGQLIRGSASWPNPYVVEVLVCRVGVGCSTAEALQPPFLLRSHATEEVTSILSVEEVLALCPVGEDRVQIHVHVAGDSSPSLHRSIVVGCDPCGRGQEMLHYAHAGIETWTCRSCQPTEYVVSTGGGCKPCPLEGASCDGESLTPTVSGAEWVAENATMRVQSCPAGYILVRDPLQPVLDTCVMCPPGKYSVHPPHYPDSMTVDKASAAPLMCSECIWGAECLGGADIIALPGFWEDQASRAARRVSFSDEYVTLYQCSPGACRGNNSCGEGRHGAACGLCDESYARSGLTCVHCGTETSIGKPEHLPSFIITVVLACVVVYLLTWRPLLVEYEHAIRARLCCMCGGDDDDDGTHGSNTRWHALKKYVTNIQWTSPAMIGAFKVAISFYQVSSTFNITFRIAWPEDFSLIFSLGRLTGLDLTIILPSVACMSSEYDYMSSLVVFTTLFPIGTTACLCVPYLLTRLLGAVRYGGSREHPKHDVMLRSCLRAVLLWLFLIYPTVSEHSLATFLCEDLGSGGHVLVMDKSVACPWGGAAPTGGFYFALFLVALYPLGIPAFFYYIVSAFFVPAMADGKYRRALFSELVKLYRRETSTPITMKLAHHVGLVRSGSTDGASSAGNSPKARWSSAPTRANSEDSSETRVTLHSFKRRVSQLFTQTFVQRELSGAVPEPAVYDKLQHVLEQFGCGHEDLVRVVTVLQRLSINISVGEELNAFEQLAARIAHNHFLFNGHETLDDLSLEQLQALFIFDWEALNRKRSESEIRKRKVRRQHMMRSMDRDELRQWVFAKARQLEKEARVTVPTLNWNGESEEEERALGFVGFLFDDFRVQTWWFFLLGEFCKLIMTSVLVFIPGHFWQQLAWGFFIQVCITSLYVVYQPMAERWLNGFQVYALCLQSAVLFFGLLLSFSEGNAAADRTAFAPWASLLVVLKWSLAFYPLVVTLLGKAERAVTHRLQRLVQGSDTDTEEREPTCVERILFPTASNNKIRLHRASLVSETSVAGLRRPSVSDHDMLSASPGSSPRHSLNPATAGKHRLRACSSVDAQLVSTDLDEVAPATPRPSELPTGAVTPRLRQQPAVVSLAADRAVTDAIPEDLCLSDAVPKPSDVAAPAVVPPTPAVQDDSEACPGPAAGPRASANPTELELSVVPTPRK